MSDHWDAADEHTTFGWDPMTATRLVNELVEAADDKQLARTIARYGRVDLLMIDECAAIIDRLTYGGNIIETGSHSYRMASTQHDRRS